MHTGTNDGKGMMAFHPKSLEVKQFLFQKDKGKKTIAFMILRQPENMNL